MHLKICYHKFDYTRNTEAHSGLSPRMYSDHKYLAWSLEKITFQFNKWLLKSLYVYVCGGSDNSDNIGMHMILFIIRKIGK